MDWVDFCNAGSTFVYNWDEVNASDMREILWPVHGDFIRNWFILVKREVLQKERQNSTLKQMVYTLLLSCTTRLKNNEYGKNIQ